MNLKHAYVLSIPYAAALASVGSFRLAGLSHSGFIWPPFLVIGCLLALVHVREIKFPIWQWIPFLALACLSLAWGSWSVRANLQTFLLVLSPFVVGVVSSMASNDESVRRQLRIGCMIALGYLATWSAFFYLGPGQPMQDKFHGVPVGIQSRPMGMTLVVIGAMFVARCRENYAINIFGWLFCFSVAVFTGSRMAGAALLFLWMAHPCMKWWTRPVVLVIGVFVTAIALQTPTMQARFFRAKGGNMSDIVQGRFSATGRLEAWPLIWADAQDSLILGKGIGESKWITQEVWPAMDKPHCDYLRIVYELGFVGLACFLVPYFLLLFKLWSMSRSAEPDDWVPAAAFLCLVSFGVLALTGNPLIYAIWFMNPSFALCGLALSQSKSLDETSEPPVHKIKRPALIALRNVPSAGE